MLERNTSGLQEHAQKKRDSAIERTEQAIQKLVKEKKNINFGAVAEEAGVSRTWLYKQTEIRERIEGLRNKKLGNSPSTSKLSSEQKRITSYSQSNETTQLQQQVKKLETENLVLRQHLEIVYGLSESELVRIVEMLQVENAELKRQMQEIIQPPDLNQNKAASLYNLKEENKKLKLEIEGLRKYIDITQDRTRSLTNIEEENTNLKQQIKDIQEQLDECHRRKAPPLPLPKDDPKVTSLDKKRSNKSGSSSGSNKVKSELDALKIKMNSTLSSLVSQAPEEVVLKAIEALKEALSKGKVRNPSGFLASAIENTWIPNEGYEEKVELDVFNEWFPVARSKRLVVASTKMDAVQYVCTPEGEWVMFEEMIAKYPLERLQEMA